jgi:hypothetical protein
MSDVLVMAELQRVNRKLDTLAELLNILIGIETRRLEREEAREFLEIHTFKTNDSPSQDDPSKSEPSTSGSNESSS